MITTYQIRNVLRTYGNQLKKKSQQINDSAEPAGKPADSVNISVEARKKQVLNLISSDMISQVTHKNDDKIADNNLSKENPLKENSGERILYEN